MNPGNVLSPREGHRPVYLLDRQPFDWSLTTWLWLSRLQRSMAAFHDLRCDLLWA